MINHSLTDITSVINGQINIQEELSERLCKLEAILSVTSAERISEYDKFICQNYLWAICDMIRDVKEMNDKALLAMMKSREYLGINI